MTDARGARWTAALEAADSADWRDVGELLGPAEFDRRLALEFPAGAAELAAGMSRRDFMQLLGASAALAGLGACTARPREPILPHVSSPAEFEPGTPQWYATTMTLGGLGTGLLVESHDGHPSKIEGNPDHPASLGAAGILEQASLLQLYDPHRARRPRAGRRRTDWSATVRSLADGAARSGARGAGLHLLLEPTASPSALSALARLLAKYPDAGVHWYAPLAADAPARAAAEVFGRPLCPIHDFSRADVVFSLGADFLASGPFHLRHARDFATRRRPAAPGYTMSRMYVAEPVPTITGSSADHRLRVRPSEMERLAGRVLAAVAGHPGVPASGIPASVHELLVRSSATPEHAEWIDALAGDLVAAAGRSIVIAGDGEPEPVHRIAHALNAALGNFGGPVSLIPDPLPAASGGSAGIASLVDAMQAGAVHTLLMLDTNPVYTAPADLEFGAALRRVPESVSLGLFEDETGAAASGFVPLAHYLESWGDARAVDGTASLVQPLLMPLYGGKTVTEFLAALAGEGERDGHQLLLDQWRGADRSAAFDDDSWATAVRRGIVPDSAAAPVRADIRWSAVAETVATAVPSPASVELVFHADASVLDGRFANNGWLQELPDPVTKLTWDNAALIAPSMAAQLGVDTGDELRLRYRGREVSAPALVLPGVADGVVSLSLGYGRGAGDERLAAGVGASAYLIRDRATPFAGTGLELRRGNGSRKLATTQTHWTLEGRPVALHATLAAYRARPDFADASPRRPLSLYEPTAAPAGDQWAMTIDLATCTGCSACVVACQAENNIPVVGRAEVLKGREMHWMRIDRYFSGGVQQPDVVSQPMLCQHCEKAPCEYVCPVEATVHSPDGLNEMVYNRCVGTRFCSNNCPYKVRRFNWFDYNAEVAETERMAKNPDVTVRARGVMEKCTFCVQRIREGQIGAGLDGRGVRDGEVRTACQQACPSAAIVFGSLTDAGSEVNRMRADPRVYSALDELGTIPRVRYLARVTNPHPSLTPPADGG